MFHLWKSRFDSVYSASLFGAVAVFIAAGVLLTFAMPPFQVPDEPAHWSTAVTRTENFFAFLSRRDREKCSVELSLSDHVSALDIVFQPRNHFARERFSSLRRVKKKCDGALVPYGNLLTYPGVVLGKVLLKSERERARAAMAVFYLARLVNGLMVAFFLLRFVMFASRSQLHPFGAAMVSAAMLSPLCIQQSFAVSADPICFSFALSLLTVALFPNRVRAIDIALAVILAAVACNTKPPMFAFVPCAVLVALRDRVSKASLYLLGILGVAGAVGAVSVLFLYSMRAGVGQLPDKVISPSEQLIFALHNPLKVFSAIDGIVGQFAQLKHLAHPLGWLDTRLHKRTLSLWYGALNVGLMLDLIGLFFVNWQESLVPRRWRSVCRGVVAAGGLYLATLATPAVLYLTWNAVGSEGVMGMQGRYLLPSLLLIPLVPAAFFRCDEHARNGSQTHNLLVIVVAGLVAVFCICYLTELYISLAARYW